MCHSKSPAQKNEKEGDIESVAFLGECTVNSNNPWVVEVRFNSLKISMKVNNAADVSILNYDSFLKLSPLPKLNSPTKKYILQRVN